MRQLLEKTQNILIEHILVLLLVSVGTILSTLAIFLHDQILLIVQEEKAESLLVNIALYSVIMILLLSITLFYLILHKSKLKLALGTLWDEKFNPYCPNCKKPLTNYGEYEFNKVYSPGYWCMNCKEVIRLYDEENKYLGISDAKKIIKEKNLLKN